MFYICLICRYHHFLLLFCLIPVKRGEGVLAWNVKTTLILVKLDLTHKYRLPRKTKLVTKKNFTKKVAENKGEKKVYN